VRPRTPRLPGQSIWANKKKNASDKKRRVKILEEDGPDWASPRIQLNMPCEREKLIEQGGGVEGSIGGVERSKPLHGVALQHGGEASKGRNEECRRLVREVL